jgi:hypothetical protein
MINLLNYETFFLLYADGELSPAEQDAVLKFVEEHPLLEEEFNRIKTLKFSPDKGLTMMDKSLLRIEIPEEIALDYSFEPDLSIVYPNKAELYKKENILPVYWLRMVGVAAALFFTMGVAWMVMGEKENIPAIAKASRGATSPSSTETGDMSSTTITPPSSENKIMASVPNLSYQDVAAQERSLAQTGSSMNAVGTENPEGQMTIDLQQTTAIITPQVVVPDLPAISLPQQVSVQQKGNLSETVLLAAAERMATTAAPMASEPTTMFINAAMKEEKKTGLRAILRTINRRLLDEHELPQDQKFIQVANFYIPVNK